MSYDVALVPTRKCFKCKELIGDHTWHEVTILARFGQMMFEHDICPTTIIDEGAVDDSTK